MLQRCIRLLCEYSCSDDFGVWRFDSMTVWQYDSVTVLPYDSLTVWQSCQFDGLTVWWYDSLTAIPSYCITESKSCAPFIGICHHTAKFLSYFMTFRDQFLIFFCNYISTLKSGFQPMPCFQLFSISVRQFADKMSFVSPFCPSLSNVRSYWTRTSTNLISQLILFFIRKTLAQFIYLLLQL